MLLTTSCIGTLLSSCNTVAIKDEEVCGDKGSEGAHCAHLLSRATRNIPKSVWDDLRFGYLCVSPTTLGDWKTEVEQLCSLSGDCSTASKALNNISSIK